MRVIGWRAWYDDGRVFHSKEIPWEGLPEDGVVTIVLFFDELAPGGAHLRRTMEGSSYYFKAEGPAGPIYGDTEDSIEDIKTRYRKPSIKRGKWTDEETMYGIQALAAESKVP